MSELVTKIKEYYEKRQLKNPDVWESLAWAQTELAEVYEIILGWKGGWVRNNPQDHPIKTKEDLAEELGDAIFMLVVAGIVEGVDPIQAMQDKMDRKLKQSEVKVEYTLRGVSVQYPTEEINLTYGKFKLPNGNTLSVNFNEAVEYNTETGEVIRKYP